MSSVALPTARMWAIIILLSISVFFGAVNNLKELS
jgi:hypothetical protein